MSLAEKTHMAGGWDPLEAALLGVGRWSLSGDGLKVLLALSPGGPTCGLSMWCGFSQHSSWATRRSVCRVGFLRECLALSPSRAG